MPNIRATDDATAALRRLQGRLITETGDSVSYSDALHAAVIVAAAHTSEAVAAYESIKNGATQ